MQLVKIRTHTKSITCVLMLEIRYELAYSFAITFTCWWYHTSLAIFLEWRTLEANPEFEKPTSSWKRMSHGQSTILKGSIFLPMQMSSGFYENSEGITYGEKTFIRIHSKATTFRSTATVFALGWTVCAFLLLLLNDAICWEFANGGPSAHSLTPVN